MTRFENDITEDHPMATEIEPGTYYWCQCGKTAKVPFCDGSHAGTGIEPLAFLVTEPGTVAICNCGLTTNPPYCDGSHSAIE
jgi:CDGSH-type Zn-finger protein